MRSASRNSKQIELIFRNGLVVNRAVFVGRSVQVAAVIFKQDEVFALPDVFRALEHHVLEQMREPSASGPLVPRSNVVRNRDRQHRRVMVGRENHAQPVIEL